MPQCWYMGTNSTKGGMTAAQNKIYDHLVEYSTFTAENGFDCRAADTLVAKGKVVCLSRRKGSNIYQLSDRCREIEDRKKGLSDAPDLELRCRKKRAIGFPHQNFTPDPPKKKIKRPPAEYSNRATGEALIHEILKNDNGK